MTIDEAVKKIVFTNDLIYRPSFGGKRLFVESNSYNPKLCVLNEGETPDLYMKFLVNPFLITIERLWMPSPNDLVSSDWLVEKYFEYINRAKI